MKNFAWVIQIYPTRSIVCSVPIRLRSVVLPIRIVHTIALILLFGRPNLLLSPLSTPISTTLHLLLTLAQVLCYLCNQVETLVLPGF